MDELTTHIQEEIPWCLLFANDIMLLDESRDSMNAKLKRWRESLKSKGFKASRTKMEYMVCNFSRHIESAKTIVRIEDHKIPQSDSFQYLDSIISKDVEIDEDVEHRIKVRWSKWRLASKMLYEQ